MVQRILERGQIETLASRAIPRVRLPDGQVFARRAARLRQLAEGHAIGDYLRLMARVADAQQAALGAAIDVTLPTEAAIAQAAAHRMPPLAGAELGTGAWRGVLRAIADALAAERGVPAAVGALATRLRAAPDEWIVLQAAALLGGVASDSLDRAAAPFVMAALQVQWVALARTFTAERVAPLDVPGVCPLCGSLPVASIVHAQAPYQGYRYLHCALCASEWHRVRAQCSQCGNGKQIGYYTLDAADGGPTIAADAAAVRAEACDECSSYRKIVYVEHDAAVEPVADDLASLALDLLLGEQGYHRASGNPLLWQAGEE
ncbi:MAG: formate dehydrogenase accessory protein FdhE [Rhodanobacteraceae bacterium]|jgi:FdhE protein|nr:formate dehydrogenase accessory protein FdhE [Rhodanobacteraceae bacterium]